MVSCTSRRHGELLPDASMSGAPTAQWSSSGLSPLQSGSRVHISCRSFWMWHVFAKLEPADVFSGYSRYLTLHPLFAPKNEFVARSGLRFPVKWTKIIFSKEHIIDRCSSQRHSAMLPRVISLYRSLIYTD